MNLKIPMVAITVTVSLIVIAAVLLPVLDDSSKTEDVFYNDDYFFKMDKLDSDSSHVISWSKGAASKLVIDGEDYAVTWSGSPVIVACDNDLIRFQHSSANKYLNFVGADSKGGVGASSDLSATITIADGVITFERTSSGGSTTSVTTEFETAYCIDPNGDYVLTSSGDVTKYILKDTDVFSLGYLTISGVWQNVFKSYGSIEDGFTSELVSSNLTEDPVVTSQDPQYTEVNKYVDLYTINTIPFTYTYNDTESDAGLGRLIVPYEVHAELSNHLDNNSISILAAIPVMIIIAVLVGVVAAVIRNRE